MNKFKLLSKHKKKEKIQILKKEKTLNGKLNPKHLDQY